MSDDYDDPSLNIEIRTQADVGGVTDATKAVQGLSDAAGEGSGGLGESLHRLSGTSRNTGQIINGLEHAMDGGARGVGGLVHALVALARVSGTVIGATGLGGVIALIAGVGLGAIMAFSNHTHEAARGLEETGKKADTLKSKLAELEKAEEAVFKPLLDQLKEVDDHFKVVEGRIAQAKKDAAELESAQKKTADAQAEFNKAVALEGADTPEKKAYIEKKAAADKAVADAKIGINTAGQGELDARLQLHTDERQQEAQKDAVDAAHAESSKRHEELEKAKKDAAEKLKQSYIDEQAAADAAEKGLAASVHSGGASVADVAGNTQKIRDARAGILDSVKGAKATSDAADKEAAKADAEAAKMTLKIESDQLEIQNKILITQQETKEAILKLATALIDQKNADEAEVSGGGETRDKVEGDAKRASDKAARDQKRADDHQAKTDAHNAKTDAHQAASDAKKAHDEANKAQIETEKQWAREIKLKKEADREVHDALHGAAKDSQKTSRRMANMASDSSP